MPPLGWRKSTAVPPSATAKATAVKKTDAKKLTANNSASKQKPLHASKAPAKGDGRSEGPKRGRPPGSKNKPKPKPSSDAADQRTAGSLGNKKKAAGKGKQPMTAMEEALRTNTTLTELEIKELEKRGDVEGLLNGLHRYPSESEVQFQVCRSLMKLLTSKDTALADRYLTIALGGNPDAGDNYSASASSMIGNASTGRALKERLMLSIYEHGENDEELQDAAFGLLHIITYGINRQMFYQFLWCVFCHMFASTHGIQLTGSHASLECCAQCNDCTRLKLLYNRGTVSYPLNPSATNREKQDNPDAYRMLSSLLYGSDARRIKQRIVLRTGRKKQCGCSSNAYGDCPDFNCPQVPRKEKKLPC